MTHRRIGLAYVHSRTFAQLHVTVSDCRLLDSALSRHLASVANVNINKYGESFCMVGVNIAEVYNDSCRHDDTEHDYYYCRCYYNYNQCNYHACHFSGQSAQCGLVVDGLRLFHQTTGKTVIL